MSADPNIAEAAPEAPVADAWAERELAILSELAEAGLEIAQALKTRIVETVAAEPDPDNAKACADLSRAFDCPWTIFFGHQPLLSRQEWSRDHTDGEMLRADTLRTDRAYAFAGSAKTPGSPPTRG